MFSLSEDLTRHLLQWLDQSDQWKLTCCSHFYQLFNKEVIKLRLKNNQIRRCLGNPQYSEQILSQLHNPGEQLTLESGKNIFVRNWPFPVVAKIDMTDIHRLDHLLLHGPNIEFRSIVINDENEDDDDSPSEDDGLDRNAFFQRLIHRCQHSSLDSISYYSTYATTVPYFPNVKCLYFSGRNLILDLSEHYTSHLQKLQLFNCDRFDVSCLGSIPHLHLEDCEEITGINQLQNNREIWIVRCDVENTPQAFSHCEKIHLIDWNEWSNEQVFSPSRWQRAQSILMAFTEPSSIKIDGGSLASTLRRVHLSGRHLKSAIAGTTFPSSIREIELADCGDLTSLAGLGLDQIPILKLQILGLTSLEGLGGRNQSVIVQSCDKITDFSPIRAVPKVIIQDCEGFTDIRQLNGVKDLTLEQLKSLEDLSVVSLEGEHLQQLCPGRRIALTSFGSLPLAQLQTLSICFAQLSALSTYLEEGGQLEVPTVYVRCRGEMSQLSSWWRIYQKHLWRFYDMSRRNVYKYWNRNRFVVHFALLRHDKPLDVLSEENEELVPKEIEQLVMSKREEEEDYEEDEDSGEDDELADGSDDDDNNDDDDFSESEADGSGDSDSEEDSDDDDDDDGINPPGATADTKSLSSTKSEGDFYWTIEKTI